MIVNETVIHQIEKRQIRSNQASTVDTLINWTDYDTFHCNSILLRLNITLSILFGIRPSNVDIAKSLAGDT